MNQADETLAVLRMLLLAATASGLLGWACGSPDDGDTGFAFDPVPVVTTADGTPVILNHTNCEVFAADEIGVTVEAEAVPSLERWLSQAGFEVVGRYSSPTGSELLTLRVPVGSVDAAVDAVSGRAGVTAVGRNSLTAVFPVTEPTPAVSCTPAAR